MKLCTVIKEEGVCQNCVCVDTAEERVCGGRLCDASTTPRDVAVPRQRVPHVERRRTCSPAQAVRRLQARRSFIVA